METELGRCTQRLLIAVANLLHETKLISKAEHERFVEVHTSLEESWTPVVQKQLILRLFNAMPVETIDGAMIAMEDHLLDVLQDENERKKATNRVVSYIRTMTQNAAKAWKKPRAKELVGEIIDSLYDFCVELHEIPNTVVISQAPDNWRTETVADLGSEEGTDSDTEPAEEQTPECSTTDG